jgi:hypothetical protein
MLRCLDGLLPPQERRFRRISACPENIVLPAQAGIHVSVANALASDIGRQTSDLFSPLLAAVLRSAEGSWVPPLANASLLGWAPASAGATI